MPWCPQCKTKFREGFTTCSDCNVDLVDSLDEERNTKKLDDRLMFLADVTDDQEANHVENFLNSHNIGVIRKYKGTGAYTSIYMGMSSFSMSLFVLSTDYNRAKEILEDIESSKTKVIELNSVKNRTKTQSKGTKWKGELSYEEKILKSRTRRARILLILFILFFGTPIIAQT